MSISPTLLKSLSKISRDKKTGKIIHTLSKRVLKENVLDSIRKMMKLEKKREEREFKCEICREKFNNVNDLNSHVSTSHQVRFFFFYFIELLLIYY